MRQKWWTERERDRWDKGNDELKGSGRNGTRGNGELKGSGTDGTREMVN